ncbi:MAG: hypothetical protein ACLTMR_04055 [Faecalibacillus sp.]
MAILAGDFKTGLTLIVDGDPCQVMDFQHVKPGKGAAILKTKMRNLKLDRFKKETLMLRLSLKQQIFQEKMRNIHMKQMLLFILWI